MDDQIVPANARALANVDFSKFEAYLTSLGLPTEHIIASPEERARIMLAIPEFVSSLPIDVKRDARYLSKFIAGSAVGLFDASLNYVWNEVVINLRKKAVVYGLDLFFDEAVGGSLRAQYSTEDDLAGIKDKTLLDTCLKLELISEIVYKKLVHILDMRNDIGSSHPTTYSINAYELLGWLQTCINEVLREEASKSAITVKQIVENIKRATTLLDRSIVQNFSDSINDISLNLVSNLLTTLFGIYVTIGTDQIVRQNILQIATFVWARSKDSKKYDLGFAIDNYRTNLDEQKVRLSESFFEACDGNRYLSISARSVKLDILCDELMKVHEEWDNFYHEVPLIKQLMTYIKRSDDIPEDRKEKIIKTVLICRIGREVGYCNGVSPAGKLFYDKFLGLLNREQVILLLQLMNESTIRSSMYGSIRTGNMKEILRVIKNATLGDRINEIIDYLLTLDNYENTIDLRKYQKLARGIIII